jgi:hypothetical protein
MGMGQHGIGRGYLLIKITDALNHLKYAVPAIPIVAVTVGVRYQYYGVRDACGDLL